MTVTSDVCHKAISRELKDGMHVGSRRFERVASNTKIEPHFVRQGSSMAKFEQDWDSDAFRQARDCSMDSNRSPFNLPKGVFLLVSDQLSSPANFTLYQSVSDHFKHGGPSARCCVLGVSEGINKWNAVLARFVRVVGL